MHLVLLPYLSSLKRFFQKALLLVYKYFVVFIWQLIRPILNMWKVQWLVYWSVHSNNLGSTSGKYLFYVYSGEPRQSSTHALRVPTPKKQIALVIWRPREGGSSQTIVRAAVTYMAVKRQVIWSILKRLAHPVVRTGALT